MKSNAPMPLHLFTEWLERAPVMVPDGNLDKLAFVTQGIRTGKIVWRRGNDVRFLKRKRMPGF